MSEIKVELAPAEREFDGQKYILTKINYTKQSAEEDEAYHKERGRETRIVEDGIFWLVYTKVGW